MIRTLLCLVLWACPARAAERVVSLNLCADQLLVMLAPDQVAALSSLSRDPALSFVADRAADLPMVRADAEAVLRLRPDLVLAGQYGAQMAVAALEARGVPVLRLEQPSSFEAIRTEVRTVAAALGVPGRGAALIAAMDRDLADTPLPGRRAVLWGARGFASGPGSLGDAVLRAAGLRNMAAGGPLGLEALLARPPDLLVTQATPRFPSLATDLLSHPALAGLPRRVVPPALLICGGPFTSRAVRLLRE